MKYEHRKNGTVAELVEKNEKSKLVTLQFADGTFTSPTFSTFQRWWKKVDEETELVPIEEAPEVIPESLEELIPVPTAEEDKAGDGTPLKEVGKEIVKQAKEKAKKAKQEKVKKVKKEKAPAVPISDRFEAVQAVLVKNGFHTKQYEKEPKIIPVFLGEEEKRAFCNVYLGAKKYVLCMKLAEVPDGYTPDRTRNCPLGAAFDIELDKLGTMIKILKARKTIKKEEK